MERIAYERKSPISTSAGLEVKICIRKKFQPISKPNIFYAWPYETKTLKILICDLRDVTKLLISTFSLRPSNHIHSSKIVIVYIWRYVSLKGFTVLELLTSPLVLVTPDPTRHIFLLYDWRESCLLIGPICLHKSLCLPQNWSKLAQKVI